MTISIFDTSCDVAPIKRMIQESQDLLRDKKLDEAEAVCRRALDQAERTLGTDHKVYAHVLDELSQVLEQQHRYAEARDACERAIGILQEDDDHSSVHSLMMRLHHLYR